MKKIILLVAFGVYFFFDPNFVYAIPPPEFVVQAGSQILQATSIVFLTASAALGVFWARLVRFYRTRKHKRLFLTSMILLACFSLSLFVIGVEKISRTVTESSFEDEVAGAISDKIEQYDQLNIDDKTIEEEVASDPGAQFLLSYYENIGSGNLYEAYLVSKQTVDYTTYQNWYAQTTGIDVFAIYPLMTNVYSAHFALYEGEEETHYAVVLTITPSGALYKIVDSEVKVLATEDSEDGGSAGMPLALMTNEEFAAVDKDEVFIVDAREDEEYELGYFPGSVHVRFADLLAGAWVELPDDKDVIVLCWSAIRGQETAEYLRTKGVQARYLEDGAMGWVEYGGEWIGEILFSSHYSDARYTETLTTQEVREAVASGAVLVDARDAETFSETQIEDSINITAFFTPSEELEQLLDAVPANTGVVTICDDYLSCFDAKIVGIKLEKMGHIFLGRYAAPYEY